MLSWDSQSQLDTLDSVSVWIACYLCLQKSISAQKMIIEKVSERLKLGHSYVNGLLCGKQATFLVYHALTLLTFFLLSNKMEMAFFPGSPCVPM